MKIKTIIKYEAIDGKIFDTEEACVKYDSLVNKVNKIMSALPPFPKDENLEFVNGGGYIQHKKEDANKAKKQILDLANKYFGTNYDFDFIGRIMNDSGCGILYSAWWRLSCIDMDYREWGQPYFAINPTKGKQVIFVE